MRAAAVERSDRRAIPGLARNHAEPLEVVYHKINIAGTAIICRKRRRSLASVWQITRP
jgi:hypothetical protein